MPAILIETVSWQINQFQHARAEASEDVDGFKVMLLPITRDLEPAASASLPSPDASEDESIARSRFATKTAKGLRNVEKRKRIQGWKPSAGEECLVVYSNHHPHSGGPVKELFRVYLGQSDGSILLTNASKTPVCFREARHDKSIAYFPPLLDAQNARMLHGGHEVELAPGDWHTSCPDGVDFLIRSVPSDDGTAAQSKKSTLTQEQASKMPKPGKGLKNAKSLKDAKDSRGPQSGFSREIVLPVIRELFDIRSKQEEPIATTNISKMYKRGFENQVVAAKVIKQDGLGSAGYRMWREEVDILQCLDHENVVRLVGFNAQFSEIYFQYIDGDDLSLHRDAGTRMSTLTSDVSIMVCRDVASAISYIHEKDIIHNDIKPENIMLRRDLSRAMLCDFGLATKTSDLISNGGTSQYISPEYILGKRGKPADIWAFGVVMLIVLGLMPHPKSRRLFTIAKLPDKRAFSAYRKWLYEVQGYVEQASRKKGLLKRMLNEDDESRINAEELVERLEKDDHLSSSYVAQARRITKNKQATKPRLLVGGTVEDRKSSADSDDED